MLNDLAHWLALVALGVWGYLRTKDNDNASAVKTVATELAGFIKASGLANEDQNNRLTVLEEAVKHMPTDREVQRIAHDVSAIKARQEGQAELLKRMEHQTNLIHEHLLKTTR
ncbi:MAG: DUF2730 family protein [Polaromonas sp.]